MRSKDEAYEVLHANLAAVRPEYAARNIILCPICLREIPKAEVLAGGVEHILPQNIIAED